MTQLEEVIRKGAEYIGNGRHGKYLPGEYLPGVLLGGDKQMVPLLLEETREATVATFGELLADLEIEEDIIAAKNTIDVPSAEGLRDNAA